MPNPLRSITDMHTQGRDRGALYQSWGCWTVPGTAAATITSGFTSVVRAPQVFTNYAAVDDSYALDFCGDNLAGTKLIAGIEYDLGTLTVSGNSFVAGVSAPTKTPFGGTSGICAFTSVALYISVALTATTPVITITYTDDAGNTGNTATLTLPTNPTINSCFLVYPHLASGDTGIRAITNVSTSTGSAGTIKVMGLLHLAEAYCNFTTGAFAGIDSRYTMQPIYPVAASETIAFYVQNTIAAVNLTVDWCMVPIT